MHLVGFIIGADEVLVWVRRLIYSVNSSTANGRRFIRSVVETNPRDIQLSSSAVEETADFVVCFYIDLQYVA